MPASERHELSALAEEEWTAADEKPACTRLHDLCEGGMEFSLVLGAAPLVLDRKKVGCIFGRRRSISAVPDWR